MGISDKMFILKPAIKILFKFKWFYKPFMDAIKDVGIDNMRFDDSDIYWVSQRGDYKFFGLTYEERLEKYLKNKSLPKRIYAK